MINAHLGMSIFCTHLVCQFLSPRDNSLSVPKYFISKDETWSMLKTFHVQCLFRHETVCILFAFYIIIMCMINTLNSINV